MKVCYVDESGNQDTDPCLVMVGLLIDTSRLNRSKIEFGDLFDRAEALFREKLQELKASRIADGEASIRRNGSDWLTIFVSGLWTGSMTYCSLPWTEAS